MVWQWWEHTGNDDAVGQGVCCEVLPNTNEHGLGEFDFNVHDEFARQEGKPQEVWFPACLVEIKQVVHLAGFGRDRAAHTHTHVTGSSIARTA